LADANLKRYKRLYDDKIAAQKDVLQAQTDYDIAVAKLNTAKTSRDIMLKTLRARIGLIQEPIRQRLLILGVDAKRIHEMLENQRTLTTVPVMAARSGVITDINASPGMSIDPSTNLFTIADLTKVWATAHVYESDMVRMHLGEKVSVRVNALPGVVVPGELTFIGSQVDPTTRTLPVRSELANENFRLKPDMYAELVIQTAESKPVLSVPKDALVMAAPRGSAVFVQQGEVFRETPVKVGRTFGDRVEILSGLKSGDKVVVRGAFQLHAQLIKEHGGDDLFSQPTEGDHHEDHATDNRGGEMHLNLQTMFVVVAAAFLLGFAISAVLLFRGRARHDCEAGDLDEDHEHPDSAPASLPVIGLDTPSPAPPVQARSAKKKAEG
jgi:membrane fusion protein, heavy metal efflux system